MLRKILCLIMCASLLLGLVSCGGDGNSDIEPKDYTIEVVTEGGMALANVGVYVYTDDTKSEIEWYKTTDSAGKVSFNGVASEDFVIEITSVPSGYKVEPFYPLSGENVKLEIPVAFEKDVDISAHTYKYGQAMFDFTVTDTNGNTLTLSELLETKKAVVLNLWYTQCNPCVSEFPYLQSAYEEYSDKLEVIGLNPVDGDDASINAFKAEHNITFPMAKCDTAWSAATGIIGYPTTIVIDRYGMIAFVHRGAVTDENYFKEVFEYYTADDYVQTERGLVK